MHSPWFGGLFQHGYLTDAKLTRRLAEAPASRIVGPFEALRHLREDQAKNGKLLPPCVCKPQCPASQA